MVTLPFACKKRNGAWQWLSAQYMAMNQLDLVTVFFLPNKTAYHLFALIAPSMEPRFNWQSRNHRTSMQNTDFGSRDGCREVLIWRTRLDVLSTHNPTIHYWQG